LGRDPGDAVVGDGGTGRIGSAGATGKSVGTAVAIGATDILPRGGGPTGVFAAVNMRAVVKELFVVLIFIHPFGGSRPGGAVGGIADDFAGAQVVEGWVVGNDKRLKVEGKDGGDSKRESK